MLREIITRLEDLNETQYTDLPAAIQHILPSRLKELILLSRAIDAPEDIKNHIQQYGLGYFTEALSYLEQRGVGSDFANEITVGIVKQDLEEAYKYFNSITYASV